MVCVPVHKNGKMHKLETTNVIRAAGVSSSASFEMLVCSIINYFFNDGAMTYINYAKAGQYAENVYWLKASGLMDQLACAVVFVSLDGFDIVTTFTSVATCLNNVGPGLEMVGPMGSFADFSAPVKLLLAFDMLAGRLELYPMLALFAPRLWRKRINAMHEARAK